MSTHLTWQDFGLPPGQDGRDVVAATASRSGTKTAITAQRGLWRMRRPRMPGERDRAVLWLRNAMIALGALAAAAAVVSFAAQFNMIVSVRHGRVIAALEAGIPDAAAAIFASLGIALALHGKRAIRARLLNVGAVATSVFMNFIAADPGWKNAAIWVMPPVAYALASDTAIGVIRSWTLARARELRDTLADDEVTPLAIVGALCLWLVRLVLAPWSTLCGFRRWVVEECPVAPGRTALPAAPAAAGLPTVTGAARASNPPVTSGSHPVEPDPRPVTPASHPASERRGRRRPGAARDWDALTKAYQKRLTGARGHPRGIRVRGAAQRGPRPPGRSLLMTTARNADRPDRSAERTNSTAPTSPCPHCGVGEPCPGCGGCECNCSCWTPFTWARYRALIPDPLTERMVGLHPAAAVVRPPSGGGTGDAA